MLIAMFAPRRHLPWLFAASLLLLAIGLLAGGA